MHTFHSRNFLLIFILSACNLKLLAQHEYLAHMDYNNLQVNLIGGSIPGVTWINPDNSAYDANHQRFFFQGNGTGFSPWYLYGIDAATGALLSNPMVDPEHPKRRFDGMQYDNHGDTLYGLYTVETGETYFSWIEPTTGVVHPKQYITSNLGYYGSTYDQKDGWYIYFTFSTVVTIDARTGGIIYQPALAGGLRVNDLVFNNANSRLYGLCAVSGQLLDFDSISLATGAAHYISSTPISGLPQLNDYTIDEIAGKYIFLGSTPGVTPCINSSLYVLDVNTGAVTTNYPYPYSQHPSNPLDSNLIEYSFDNIRGKLYAIIWHPTTATVAPLLTISASANPVCPNTPVKFSGVVSFFPDNYDSYQWKINGKDVGDNTTFYTDDHPVDGDTIRCIVKVGNACGGSIDDTSNYIVLQVKDKGKATIQITDSPEPVCSGQPVTFTAVVTDGGSPPQYQWRIDGVAQAGNSATFSVNSLQTGDWVDCVVTSTAECISDEPVVSNAIYPTLLPAVASSVSFNTSAGDICSGDTVFFTPVPVNGGNSPTYEWMINGLETDVTGGVWESAMLKDGDVVSCIMQSSEACTLPAASTNSVVMTVKATPVLTMGKDATIERGSHIQLGASATGNIARIAWTPSTWLDHADVLNPLAAPLTSTTYLLTVTDADGCAVTGKIAIRVFTPLVMPNSFTPNGDGKNDVFRIPPSIAIDLVGFSIYNRWGQRVFSTVSTGVGWDGAIGGKPQPAGAYVWEIEYRNPIDGGRVMSRGNLLLIR